MIPTLKSEMVSTEIIKPLSSSKTHPTSHNFSFFDQICARIYVPYIFFYPIEELHHKYSSIQLKNSLSAALSLYYPLAGRFKDDLTIDCNDEGIEFQEARLDSDLSEILKNPNDEVIKILFPENLQYKDPISSSFLIVKVNLFNCGGIGLAICISHKVMDMAAFSYFINHWAGIARNSGDKFRPDFSSIPWLYPSIDLPVMECYEPDKLKCVSRRVVFHGSKIDELKLMVEKEVPNPTRFEVVTAVLYKSALAASTEFSNVVKSAVMHVGTNLREKVIPQFPESSSGNFSGTFSVSAGMEMEMETLTREIKKEKIKYWKCCGEKSDGEDLCRYVLEASVGLRRGHGKNEEGYLCSSYCRYPFYEADFGWGKPAWVSLASCEVKNVMIMLDTRDGDGIEAYVSLQEQVMEIFENDHFLLSFASINPSVLPEST
ncbi:acyltransferase Pun1-like [Euphorbia lathyris]|uniref:acyltransferase Pun1-like n=1 Tax=Euphorbia lathyris TaxID=212925 RepID=UPI0033135135